jgi:hypothetical protein
MSKPMKCKYCGAAATVEGNGWRAACGSWDFGHGLWYRGDGCYLRCVWRSQGLELDKLRQRIDAAIKALQDIPRCKVYAVDQSGVCYKQSEQGHWVQQDDLAGVVEILRGNSPTISEGSM